MPVTEGKDLQASPASKSCQQVQQVSVSQAARAYIIQPIIWGTLGNMGII